MWGSFSFFGSGAKLFLSSNPSHPGQPAVAGGDVQAAVGRAEQDLVADQDTYRPGDTARILVPSPDVPTYDLKPEMSAPEVTDRLVEAIASDRFDAVICNYANGDMVGHTGNYEAAVKAIEVLDGCLGRVSDAVLAAGGAMLITADHGNAEQMVDPKAQQPHTAHTTNPVPLIYVGHGASALMENGALCDIAPTLLQIMGLPQPAAMTGRSLLMTADSDADAA
mgnify:CR=1 FL=1